MTSPSLLKYTVIKDTREKEGSWDFSPSERCEGMIIDTLHTGDYTLRGYEKDFIIERKGKISEWATNINQPRFADELERLQEFRWAYIILEFNSNDIMLWPENSGVPKKDRHKIKTTKYFILQKINEYLIKYKTRIILAGSCGRDWASSLFKRMVEYEQR